MVPGCTDEGGGEFECDLTHDGTARKYHLHIPESYAQRPASGAMLVFNFHGLNTTAGVQKYLSGMNERSDARGFVVVTPEGTGMSWNAGNCCGSAYTNQVDDVGFTLAILEHVQQSLCIDPKRVYSTGLSNGGHFSYRLACEHSETFAAIASISGLVVVSPCTPSRATPILHFHGTSDTIVSYQYGIDGVNGAEEVTSAWADVNGCSTSTEVTYQQGDVTCRAYTGCSDNAVVELCTIDGGGHQWPGGNSIPLLGHTTEDISATDYLLDFFEAHPLP
ncbi:MAG: PHB depolymerase family esterase [Myxococcota bacterium]